MAKDSRTNDEIRAEKKALKAERKRAAKKAQKKASAINVAMVVSVILIFAIALGLVGLKTFVNSGIVERHTTVMSTDNHSITSSILTYYFNSTYRSTASSYSGLIDTSKSLREQELYEGYSWYDYMLAQAENDAAGYLLMAEGAKEAGIELDEHELAEIEEIIDSFKEAAKTYGYSTGNYIKLNFGSAVSVNDMREALKLAQLAAKYQEIITDGYLETYTTADYDKQYEDNKNNYTFVDYYSYTFTAEKGEDNKMTDETKAAAKALAEELKAAEDAEAFKAIVTDYLTEKAKDELKEGESVDKDEIASAVETTLSSHVAYSTLNNASSDIAKWAFEEAAAGDVKENYSDDNGTYSVYMLETTPYRDEYVTRNGAYIYLSNSANTNAEGASAKADEIIAEWENGDKTEEAFLELVEKYSEAGHAHLEENLTKDLPFSDWLYATDRKTGEVGKVVSDSDKGVYIVYYAGESGLESWQASARADLASAAFNDHFTELSATYYVTVNNEKAARIVPVIISTSSSSSTK